jgi:hypothetical protein
MSPIGRGSRPAPVIYGLRWSVMHAIVDYLNGSVAMACAAW